MSLYILIITTVIKILLLRTQTFVSNFQSSSHVWYYRNNK